jgi:RES domain-containing protein
MLLYRIIHKLYSGSLFAPGYSGRWNSEGKKVIYTAESIALAFLESMIRRQGVGFNKDFKIMIIQVPDDATVSVIEKGILPKGWRAPFDYSKCQTLGNNWYDEAKTLLLKVPSAVLPDAFNYAINTLHPDYKKVQLLEVTDLIPDERIEEILRKSKM